MINAIDPKKIHQQLNSQGYATIQDAFNPELMGRFNTYIDKLTESSGLKYQSAVGRNAMAGSGLDELGASESLKAFLLSICQLDNFNLEQTDEIFQVLRVLAGSTGVGQSHLYHFDAYYLTLAVPIRIPQSNSGLNGDLILYPNARPLRKFAAMNMLEKSVYQSKLGRKAVSSGKFPFLAKPKRIAMIPGNAYLFYGYQTLHGNDACEVDQVRATALFHFGELHANSKLVKYVEKRRTQSLVGSDAPK